MTSVDLRRSLVSVACLIAAAIAFVLTWGSAEPYATLHASGGFTQNGEFPSRNANRAQTPRFGSWSGSDAHVGELQSDLFRAGLAMTLLIDGYPAHDGNTIYLERDSDHARYPLQFAENPGETWTRVAYRIPLGWIGSAVRLHAVDSSGRFEGWIGIADVRSTNLLATLNFPDTLWPIGGSAFLFCTGLFALWPVLRHRHTRGLRFLGAPALFLTIAGATVMYFRLPVFTTGILLNVDEAQMTAQAITFLHHPIPWADYDGTTSGPLNTMIVALPRLAGFPPNLPASRFIAAALLVATLVFFYHTMCTLWNDVSARIAVLFPLALVCGLTDESCVQYASELPPMLLSTVALWCMASIYRRKSAGTRIPALLGTAIGALVFAKLQAAPLAVLLFVVSAALIRSAVLGAKGRTAWFAFAAGVCCVPAVILIAVAAAGAFGEFLTTYVIFPRTYVAENCCHFAGLDFFLSQAPFAAFFLLASMLAAALLAVPAYATVRGHAVRWKTSAPPLLFFIVMTITAVYMIEAPQTPFSHYLLFMIVPVSATVGTLIGTLMVDVEPELVSRRVPALLSCAVIAMVPATQGALNYDQYLNHNLLAVQSPRDPLVPQLQHWIHPGQRVAMWGWSPQYLVYTRAIMGTRDSIAQFQIEPRSVRPYYRARYVRDFLRNTPDFLMEAIGPTVFNYTDRATQGVAGFPKLAAILREHYTPVFDERDVRLFARNDLVKH